VLDVRVYRAAFLPALIAVFVAAFSLADRPVPTTTASRPTPSTPATRSATARTRSATRSTSSRGTFPTARPAPRRRPAADRVAETFERRERGTSRPAFEVSRSTASGRTADLETVVGVRPGLSNRRIVVVASRDARGHPGRAELSGTAALLELARIYRQRELRKTLVLVSTSGATTGFAGARAWAREPRTAAPPIPVDAVSVLGDMAGRTYPQAVGRAVVGRGLARPARAPAHGRVRAARRGPRRTPAARTPRASGSAARCR
jgi:hypothetical protein